MRLALLLATLASGLGRIRVVQPQPLVPTETSIYAGTGDVIPRLIWSYWSDKALPEFVAACFSLIESKNPDWKLNIMYGTDIEEWGLETMPGDHSDSPEHIADWYRLAALEKYGGVWLDASIIVLNDMSMWVNMSQPALQGFANPSNNVSEYYLVNWAFATPANTSLMTAWKNNLRQAISMGEEAYVASLPSYVTGPCLANISYLAAYSALRQALYQLKPNIQLFAGPAEADPSAALRLMHSDSVTDGIRGPYMYQGPFINHTIHNSCPYLTSWQQAAAVEAVFDCHASTCSALQSAHTPFIKLRETDRACVLCPLSRYGDESYIGDALQSALYATHNSFSHNFSACPPPIPGGCRNAKPHPGEAQEEDEGL